jgi:hypothetical protein
VAVIERLTTNLYEKDSEGQPKLHRYGIVPDTNKGIHHFFKNICRTQWILDIGYNTGTSIKYDTGTGTWFKMEYPCNLGDNMVDVAQ